MNRRDPMGTPPMFEMAPTSSRKLEPRPRAQRPAGWASCPQCSAERVAIVNTPSHLVWREHTYTTYSGARMTCGASGVPLCRAPCKRGEMRCGHEISAGDGA